MPTFDRSHALAASLITLALVLSACSGSPSPPPDDDDPTTPPAAATWSKSLGGPGDDWANAVIGTRDGGFLFAGVFDHQQTGDSGLPPIDGDFWVTKLDQAGDLDWQLALGEKRAAAAGTDALFKRARAGLDGYWMVGTQVSPGPSGVVGNPDGVVDLLVARLNDDGSVRWTRSYDSGGFAAREFFRAGESARDSGWDVWPTPDGGALLAAWSSAVVRVDASNGIPVAAPWIIKVDATGIVQWSRRISETQFDYLPEEPAELLVRATAQNGAVVAASARVRGDGTEQGPKPAMQLTLLDQGGAVPWTRRYSRLIARDLIQVEDANEDDVFDGGAEDGFVIVGDDIAIWYTLDGDRDSIVMKFSRDDGDEEWRSIIEEGAVFETVVQMCHPTPSLARYCHYVAGGRGSRNDEGALLAMSAFVDPDGDLFTTNFYDDLAIISDLRIAAPGAADINTPLQAVGYASAGGTFRMLIRPNLTEVSREFTAYGPADGETRPLPTLQFDNDARVVSIYQPGDRAHLQVFGNAGESLVDRNFGAGSEFRGERAFAAVEMSNGYVVAGQSDSIGEAARPGTVVAKLRPDVNVGDVLWQVRLDDFSLLSRKQQPYVAIAPSTDGGVVLAGVSATDGVGPQPRAIKLDANGAVLWNTVPLNPEISPQPIATGIVARSDGGYYVIGEDLDFVRSAAPWVTRIDDAGGIVWQRQLPIGGALSGIDVTSDGGVIVAGVAGSQEDQIPWAARISAAGTLLWSRSFEVGNSLYGPLARIVTLTDGGYLLASSHLDGGIFAGESALAAAGRRNILLIRLDADGAARWHRTYGGLYDETLFGLDALPDGGFVVAGRSDSLGERGEAWVMRLGPDGRINEGCNALRTAEVATNYAPLALGMHDRNTAVDRRITGSSASRVSTLPTQLLRQPAVARQCAGFTQADAGGAPPLRHRLNVVQGNVSAPGVVTSAPGGISCGTGVNQCDATYLPNTTVTLAIDSGERGRFLGFTGCDVATAYSCILTMTADRTVTATFRAANAPRFTLNVAGNGRVSGAGLDCRNGSSGTCGGTYSPGEILALSATADATEAFLGWGGACASFARGSPIDLEMTGNLTCSAEFTGGPPGSPRVTVTVSPAVAGPLVGYVRSVPAGITCGSMGSDCTQTFTAGSTVRLEGISTDANYSFETFTCTGLADVPGARTVEFTITTDVSCQARFATGIERLQVRLVADTLGGIGFPGRVIAVPPTAGGSLDCTADCDRPFARHSIVLLRAEPSINRYLSGWSGCDAETLDPQGTSGQTVCHVGMQRTRNVVAFFSGIGIGPDGIRQLAISFPYDSGAGTVTANRPTNIPPCVPGGDACKIIYDIAEEVLLTVVPDGSNTLTLNEGCNPFTPATATAAATCRVIMDRDRGVVFNFGTVNAVPVAVITSNATGDVGVGQPVDFSASSSTDDGGNAQLMYQWDFDENGSVDSTAVDATYAWNAPGLYRVRLAVTDSTGATDTDDVEVTVVASDNPPVASFTYSPGSPQTGNAVSFDATSSTDDVGIVIYRWDFDGDGVTDAEGFAANARVRQFTYAAAGTYLARLTVIDAAGLSDQTTRTVTVASAPGALDLTLMLRGSGHGVVTYLPVVTACSKDSEPTCVRQFAAGTVIVLTGSAYSGSLLGDWVGCTSLNAAGTQCTVNLTSSRTVTLFIN